MARYGAGAEDFNQETAKLNKMAAALAEITSKELQAAEGADTFNSAEERAGATRRTGVRIRQESAELSDRAAAANKLEAQSINVTTQAIERQAAARARAASVTRQALALRGATDPAFSAAAGVPLGPGGAPPSQSALRQQLAVGQRRAAAIQAAIGEGFVPRAGGPAGGLTATQALSQRATARVVEADVELAQAKRAYSAATRSGNVAEAQAANASREQAQAKLLAARADEQVAVAADAEANARRQAATAAQGSAVAEREAAAQAARTATGGSPRFLPAKIPGNAPVTGVEGFPRNQPEEYARYQLSEKLRLERLSAARAEAVRARAEQEAAQYAQSGEQNAASARARAAAASAHAADPRAPYLAGLGNEGAKYRLDTEAKAAEAHSRVADTLRRESGEFQRAAAIGGTYDQSMFRHGLLTSEFIDAAGKGRVTVRELGTQLAGTAGKFAGWTAAATGVFAVAGALGKVAHGAIESQSQAQNLTRFIEGSNTNQIGAGLEGLSKANNVGISDVGAAQTGFARVTPDLKDSIVGADTALKAYALDQIPVADATRYLVALHQEFGIEVNKIPLAFDQISAAQRKVGARSAEVLPALAKSAAAVRNAGGDFSQLLGLVATAQVATGQTGNTVGTAFSRSAANFERSPASQKVIQGFDIDTSKGYTQTIINAVQRSRTLNGDDRTALAKAIGGPQYGGRIFQTLLGQGDRLNKTLDVTSPAKAAGNAQDELNKRLQQGDQIIKSFGLALERLGSALVRAGALDLGGGLLKGLIGALNIVNGLVNTFDKLPHVVKTGVTSLAEMAVVLKTLQRFGATAPLEGTALSFLDNPAKRQRTRFIQGLESSRNLARDQVEGLGNTYGNRAGAAARAGERFSGSADRYLSSRASFIPGNAASEAKMLAAEEELVKDQYLLSEAIKARNAAELEARSAAQVAAAADERYAEGRSISVREFREGRAQSAYGPRQSGVPNNAGVGLLGGTVEEQAARAEGTAAAEASRLSARGAKLEAKLSALAGATTGVAGGTRLFGAAGPKITRAGEAAASAAGAALTKVEAAPAALAAAGGRLSGLAAAIGPLGLAIGGAFAVQGLIDSVKTYNQQVLEAQDALNAATPTLQAERDQVAAAHKKDKQTLGSRLYNAGAQISRSFGVDAPELSTSAPERQRVLDNARQRGALQRREASRGQAITGLTYDQLIPRIEDDSKAVNGGLISQREFTRRMALHAKEAKFLLDATVQQVNEAKKAIVDAQRSGGSASDYKSSLVSLNLDDLSGQVSAISQDIKDFGGTSKRFSNLRAAYAQAAQTAGANPGSDDAKKLSAARSQYFGSLSDSIQEELKNSLQSAGSEGGRSGAYRTAIAAAQRRFLSGARANRTQALANRDGALRTQAAAERGQDKAGTQAAALPGVLGTLSVAGLAVSVAADKKRVSDLKGKVGIARKEYGAAVRAYNVVVKELRDAQYQDAADGRQIALALLNSQTGSPLKQAANTIRAARAQLAAATARGAAGFRDREQALTSLNAAIQQQDQAILAGVQANNALILAQAGNDPLRQAAATVQGSRNNLNELLREQAKGHNVDPNAITSARADLITQQNSQQAARESAAQAARDKAKAARDKRKADQEKRRQDALEIAALQSELSVAEAGDDPLKVAQIEQKTARAAVKTAKGKKERLQAQINLVKANQAVASASLTDAEGTIDFNQQMGDITAQQAQAQYEALLKNKNLTTAQRRELLLKVKGLKDQAAQEAGGFDLDTSGIKLPTIYDVRKAFDPIRDSVKAARDATATATKGVNTSNKKKSVNGYGLSAVAPYPEGDLGFGPGPPSNISTANVQNNVYVTVTDPGAAGQVYSAIDRALSTTVAARMRSKGRR